MSIESDDQMSDKEEEVETIERDVPKVIEEFNSGTVYAKHSAFNDTLRRLRESYVDSSENYYEDAGSEDTYGESAEVHIAKTTMACKWGFAAMKKYSKHANLIEKAEQKEQLTHAKLNLKACIKAYSHLIKALEKGNTKENTKDLAEQFAIVAEMKTVAESKGCSSNYWNLEGKKRKIIDLTGVSLDDMRAVKKKAVETNEMLFNVDNITKQVQEFRDSFTSEFGVEPYHVNRHEPPVFKFDKKDGLEECDSGSAEEEKV